MSEQIILREYQKTDSHMLETIIRETWRYDRFCSSKTAANMARLYLSTCLTNQTFTRVVIVNDTPVGIIMGKNIQKHKCPLALRVKWLKSIVPLYISNEGRRILKIFKGIDGIDRELLSACGKDYKGEVTFFAINENYRGKGLGRKLFETLIEYMESQNISDFYLFTDTSCNYPFYEHLGLKRRCEKRKTIDIKTG